MDENFHGFTKRTIKYLCRSKLQRISDQNHAKNCPLEHRNKNSLSLFPNFDITTSFSTEYMYAVLLGVVRTFVDVWFDGPNKNQPYYLRRRLKKFDERLFSTLLLN